MPEPVVTVREMREREERTWAAGVSQEAVIRRAGMAVAAVAARWIPEGATVLVLAGRGHNGDDAAVAASVLEGRQVTLCRLREPEAFATARAWLARNGGRRDAWVIDGLFGIGLNRPLDGAWSALVMDLNRLGLPVLAVDVPSGLDADTGESGGATVMARCTVALGAVKRGLLATAATAYVGRLELAWDIGLLPWMGGLGYAWTLPQDFDGFPPSRGDGAHKGTFGHAVVVAGSPGYHGAAVLAARGALKARPGLVTVVTEPGVYVPVASSVASAMVRAWAGEPWVSGGATSVVVGPGLASAALTPAWRGELERLWREAPCPVVVDASALDWLPAGGSTAGVRVITPHPGEAGRLLGTSAAAVQADRPAAVQALLGRWPGADVWVVLKGRHTLVSSAGRSVLVNPSGNPGLAQGGSGDVLAGYLGGLLAQSVAADDLGRAVRYGVWRHGAVADALEATGEAWTSEDLAAAMGRRLPG